MLRRGSSTRPIIGIWKGVCITEQSRLWPPHSKYRGFLGKASRFFELIVEGYPQ